MIIRTPKRDRYVIISKVPLEDKRLSWKARGLHAYLMSKPDHWTVIVKALVNEAPDGRDSVMTALRELERYGYITHKAGRDDNNKFDGTEWTMFEEPMDSTADGFSASGLAVYGESAPSEEGTGVNNEKSDSSSADGGLAKVSRLESLFTTRIWEHYPRKAARKAALKAFTARIREGISPDDLETATKNYALSRAGQDPQFTMLGGTFYGPNERWKDFVDSTTPQQAAAAQVDAAKMEQVKRDQADWEQELERRHEEAVPMSEEMKKSLRRKLTMIGT